VRRLDSANRSFVVLVLGASLVGSFVLCGIVADTLVPLVRERANAGGWRALVSAPMLPVLVLVAAVVVAVARAVAVVRDHARASQALDRRVQTLTIDHGDAVGRAVAAARMTGRVVLVDERERYSFVYGALSPRVVLSRGLAECLSEPELRAVLEHEHYHVTNLDPLKTVAIRTLSAGLFFAPVLGRLRARYELSRELAADHRAVTRCGRSALAGALLKAVRTPAWVERETIAPLTSSTSLAQRVTHLESGTEPAVTRFDAARALLYLVTCATVLTGCVVLMDGVAAPAGRVTAIDAVWLEGAVCALPFLSLGLVAYLALSNRARRPLTDVHSNCGFDPDHRR
jgi:Zn-dependent protease with chaperone function